jgi:glycine hydroxymethyltransferase
MRTIAGWIVDALDNRNDAGRLNSTRKQVMELAESFPLYSDRRKRAASQQPAVVS